MRDARLGNHVSPPRMIACCAVLNMAVVDVVFVTVFIRSKYDACCPLACFHSMRPSNTTHSNTPFRCYVSVMTDGGHLFTSVLFLPFKLVSLSAYGIIHLRNHMNILLKSRNLSSSLRINISRFIISKVWTDEKQENDIYVMKFCFRNDNSFPDPHLTSRFSCKYTSEIIKTLEVDSQVALLFDDHWFGFLQKRLKL